MIYNCLIEWQKYPPHTQIYNRARLIEFGPRKSGEGVKGGECSLCAPPDDATDLYHGKIMFSIVAHPKKTKFTHNLHMNYSFSILSSCSSQRAFSSMYLNCIDKLDILKNLPLLNRYELKARENIYNFI